MFRPEFKYAKWIKIIETELMAQISTMKTNRDEFLKIKDQFNNGKIKNELFSFIKRNYASAMSMAVRRAVDRHSQAVSLIKLLDDIANNAGAITKEAFAKISPDPDLPDDFFENGILKKEIVIADITFLSECTKPIKENSDKWFAHWDKDRRKLKQHPTFNDLNRAVDCIIDIYTKYYRLIEESEITFV